MSTMTKKTLPELIKSIAGQLSISMGNTDKVKQSCLALDELLSEQPGENETKQLKILFSLIQKRSGTIVDPVFNILLKTTTSIKNPWSWLKELLLVRQKHLVLLALHQSLTLAKKELLKVDRSVLHFFSGQFEKKSETFRQVGAPEIIEQIIKHYPASTQSNSNLLLSLYLYDEELGIRMLAAVLLDQKKQPVPNTVATKLLKARPYAFFEKYLTYTRAGYTDLLHLNPEIFDRIQYAEKLLGYHLLRNIISKLGWPRVNIGLEVKQLSGISINGALPLMLSAAEAALLKKCPSTKKVSETFLIIAHGQSLSETSSKPDGNDRIKRFRQYNLNHAAMLVDILEVASLSVEKVHRMLKRMEKIVRDYITLFSEYSDECEVLPNVFNDLKGKINIALEHENQNLVLSTELTQLVQAFEDPKSLKKVETLHSLKRYLHQQGLKMGFHLVGAGQTPNKTVDILTVKDNQIQSITKAIRYTNFEPETTMESWSSHMPFAVQVVIDGFSRQILHGQTKIPNVRIFCYGNEVHYYLTFRNHPALLRIDYSPPSRGGMIDLEYFGVSNYELNLHPNVSLDAIRLFFKYLEFDIQIDGTHIHSRYDKERALNLGDICNKAEVIFRLAPYLMDIDWLIGSLNLSPDSKHQIGLAWAKAFALQGILPFQQILSKDRLSILLDEEKEGIQKNDIIWKGEPPYRDCLFHIPPQEFFDILTTEVEKLHLPKLLYLEEDFKRPMGQIRMETLLLNTIRKALACGTIQQTPEGFKTTPEYLFRKVPVPEHFVRRMAKGIEKIVPAIAIAKIVLPLEQMLNFQNKGSINGYIVESAFLSLRGETITMYILRDQGGIICLAYFSHDPELYIHREKPSGNWISNASDEAETLEILLRNNNYFDPTTILSSLDLNDEASKTHALIKDHKLPQMTAPILGEKIISGMKASPGRVVGKALFGTEDRLPGDFKDAILISATIKPEDNTYLYHSAGIVSTGGGILSHAGLIAIQFQKPALIIAGKWNQEKEGHLYMNYISQTFSILKKNISGYEVYIRHNLQESEHRLKEEDLVILDANEGTLSVLGQDRDALALYEGFRLYASAIQLLNQVNGNSEILTLRGRKLRAHHQLEKIFLRVTNPVLAHYIINEILLGKIYCGKEKNNKERACLLNLILKNRVLKDHVRDYLLHIYSSLKLQYQESYQKALEVIPNSVHLHEIISLRLDLIHTWERLENATMSLKTCKVGVHESNIYYLDEIDKIVKKKLETQREQIDKELKKTKKADFLQLAKLRHMSKHLERIDLLLPVPEKKQETIEYIKNELSHQDKIMNEKLSKHYVIQPPDAGFGQFAYIGWKAANLAEIEHLAGTGLVPQWFVITDHAFISVLQIQEDGLTLKEKIDEILNINDISNEQKSARINLLWKNISLPQDFTDEVLNAYRNLVDKNIQVDDERTTYVAIRSSSREEDAEIAARAGEFETFLFIHGEQSLLDYLKQTWSGLWTERAIHNRTILGNIPTGIGGGVIIQRIVHSQVSGVLQTINVADEKLDEMVISVGLGMGEGIVSGTVSADQIIISKNGDLTKGPLNFRYITMDKTEQVVFDKTAGTGTIHESTLYHQRLRPALDYVNLQALIAIAHRLELAYGYPLDIEFGFEESRLWILQVRPVATFSSSLHETLEQYPLNGSKQLNCQ